MDSRKHTPQQLNSQTTAKEVQKAIEDFMYRLEVLTTNFTPNQKERSI